MKVTGIGGGHGLAVSLRAARLYADDISAVVTVADDGGSSGRLTRELGIPPPGDLRNCLVALSEPGRLADMYQHRFRSGALTGHTVGNLLIAALTEMTGDFGAAVEAAGRLLGARGRVFPATNEVVSLHARAGGQEVRGQVAVAQSEAPIQAVFLEPPDPPAHPGALEAIGRADQILLGPGSLFTSLIATLLVPDVRHALQEAVGSRVFVCNARMQKGETWGLDASAHVEALLAHIGPYAVDTVVVQSPVHQESGVLFESGQLASLGVEVVEVDALDGSGEHDPSKLAEILAELSPRRG